MYMYGAQGCSGSAQGPWARRLIYAWLRVDDGVGIVKNGECVEVWFRGVREWLWD